MLRHLLPAAFLLIPAPLRAECMMIQPFVAGPEVVPPDPKLVLFWPREYYPKAPKLQVHDQNGRPLVFTLERLSLSQAYDAYSLKIAAPDGTKIQIEDESHRGFKDAFRVDSAWTKAPAAGWDYKVLTSTYAWACSFERIRIVSVPAGAAAYRVEWTPPGGGRAQSLVVPAQSAWFFSRKEPRRGGRDEVKLGHLNCSDWNFRWDDPSIELKLARLFPDGTEEVSPPLKLEAPPRLVGERGYVDVPEDLRSPYGAWLALVWALRSGRPENVRRVTTRAGWADLKRALGEDPARLAEAGAGWGDTPLRWKGQGEKVAEAGWGPEIKEHYFRFVLDGSQWRLDHWNAGD